MYLMSGVDDHWIDAGVSNYVRYAHLNPGDYIFHVKGCNSASVWNENGTSIAISITPPYWRTWWFRILLGFVMAGLLYTLYRYRISQLLKIERLRVKVASDLHDDVGSALTKIAVHSEVIQTTNDPGKIETSSRQIGSLSREVIGSLSDIVWSIDARHDALGDLIDRMRKFATDLLESKNIELEITISDIDALRLLSVDTRQNIYLIFKEALNNVTKHSGATYVRVSIAGTNGELLLSVSDNGCGLQSSNTIRGHGLKNMRSRAEQLGGTLSIEGEGGTVITLKTKI
jgi:signal transduction histidine kinase